MHIHLTHTHTRTVTACLGTYSLTPSPTHILSVTHVLSFTHTTSHSYTPLLSTPRLSHSPWVPMASTAKGDPGSVSLPSARIPSSARGLLLPGLLLSAGAGPGGGGSRGCVAQSVWLSRPEPGQMRARCFTAPRTGTHCSSTGRRLVAFL